jgi:hypothetical protein
MAVGNSVINLIGNFISKTNFFALLVEERTRKQIKAIKSPIFWYITLGSALEFNQHFRECFAPHLKGQASFMLVSSLAYSSILKMEASCPSKTSLDFQQTIWRYVPEDRTLHNHQCENLKFCTNNTIPDCIYLKYTMIPKALFSEFLDIIIHLIFLLLHR